MNKNNAHMKHDIQKYHFISELKQLQFVEKVILFGSRARGTNRIKSDIDLAIVCPHATNQDWHTVLDIVENADTLLTIDCVRLDEANQKFKNNILEDGIEL